MIEIANTIQDVREKMENGTYDMTVNGECSQCGSCCTNFLPMTRKEIREIRRYVKKHGVKEYRRNFPVSGLLEDLTCPFMDDSKKKEKCRIYPVRPEICRQFICCPEKRKPFKGNVSGRAVVDVRREFFNENH